MKNKRKGNNKKILMTEMIIKYKKRDQNKNIFLKPFSNQLKDKRINIEINKREKKMWKMGECEIIKENKNEGEYK